MFGTVSSSFTTKALSNEEESLGHEDPPQSKDKVSERSSDEEAEPQVPQVSSQKSPTEESDMVKSQESPPEAKEKSPMEKTKEKSHTKKPKEKSHVEKSSPSKKLSLERMSRRSPPKKVVQEISSSEGEEEGELDNEKQPTKKSTVKVPLPKEHHYVALSEEDIAAEFKATRREGKGKQGVKRLSQKEKEEIIKKIRQREVKRKNNMKRGFTTTKKGEGYTQDEVDRAAKNYFPARNI